MDRQIDGQSEPKVPCVICKKPVALLSSDICSDEKGNPVHAECYVKRIAHGDSPPAPASHERPPSSR